MLSFPHSSVCERHFGAMLAQTGVHWPSLFPEGSMAAWSNVPQKVETVKSPYGAPEFSLGVQFFLYKTEISASGGCDWYCDRTCYNEARGNQKLNVVAVFGPSLQLVSLKSDGSGP